MDLVRWFAVSDPGISFPLVSTTGTVIYESRNALATLVLIDNTYTHLLFIDSDIGFRASVIKRMVDRKQPILGALYPRRHKRPGPLEFIGADALSGEPDAGFMRTEYVGCGLMLIERSALLLMREKLPSLWTTAETLASTYPWCQKGLFQPFAPIQRPDGAFLSEDMAFCWRWTNDCGGEIWACIDEQIVHAGVAAKFDLNQAQSTLT